MCSVAVFVPRTSAAGSAVTVSVTPSGPRTPDDGVTVSHGLSAVTVNATGVLDPGMNSVCTTLVTVPTSALACDCVAVRSAGMTNIPTTSEYGPRSSLQGETPRTR